MITAKVHKTGENQTVILPENCRFSSDKVIVNKIGDTVLLIPPNDKWDSFIQAIDMFSDDFMSE
ncbi:MULTISPECIES: antitoxin [Butyrivibrio]|uniref:antitoxin n=1 Tax=Butyrivibrio TaxID=830 RepID=UPI00047E14A9|nr:MULTISPECIES: AbrB family transcriptional regulator [Butyrivibrio]SFU70593.1 antitoxin VapB [Butyrivibrio sp. M55]